MVMLHVILFQPEIPPNTGNIVRLCANTGAQLHLIYPLGFVWEDARLRRAGLDYHDWAQVRHHASLPACLEVMQFTRLFAISVKGTRSYTNVAYQPGDALLFGPESCGLPPEIRQGFPPEYVLRIPMQQSSRSINLSNAVAIVLYEAWRQLGFVGGG
jgi:tRNA (cytidine/uridine-2'-O-)-methyltransferase